MIQQGAMYRISAIGVLLLIVFSPAMGLAATAGENPSKECVPEKVVQSYIEMDLQGYMFHPEKRRLLQALSVPRLVDSGIHGDELAVVVQGYKRKEATVSGDIAVVTVEYSVVGQLENKRRFVQARRTKNRVFRLKRSAGVWKLTNLSLPHISQKTAVQLIRENREPGWERQQT
jgi:hypothetical protein